MGGSLLFIFLILPVLEEPGFIVSIGYPLNTIHLTWITRPFFFSCTPVDKEMIEIITVRIVFWLSQDWIQCKCPVYPFLFFSFFLFLSFFLLIQELRFPTFRFNGTGIKFNLGSNNEPETMVNNSRNGGCTIELQLGLWTSREGKIYLWNRGMTL